MNEPFFSIIIPTLNSAATLKQCLDSVIAQTFKDYEIIVHDGISTDNTFNIIRSYSFERRLNVFSEKDEGIYDAMNKSIHKSKGKWLYFLGSDDTFHNDGVLMNVHNFICNNTIADLVYGDVHSSIFDERYDGVFDINKLLIKNISHQAMFFKKQLFETLGQYDVTLPILADYDFNLRCFTYGVNHCYIDLLIANYSAGGISSGELVDHNFHNKFWERLADYILKSKETNTQVFHLMSLAYSNLVRSLGRKKTVVFYLKRAKRKPVMHLISFGSVILR
ncbi:glycosyltransferase [Flavihumibacter sp. R14]|nr:glycosyltransferase [Flavihumibacter soli]